MNANAIEVPLIFVAAAFIGLGGLGLMIVAALSSLAERLRYLPERGACVGSGMRTRGSRGMLPERTHR